MHAIETAIVHILGLGLVTNFGVAELLDLRWLKGSFGVTVS